MCGSDRDILHRNQSLFSGIAARSPRLARFVVGSEVETDEKDEIGTEDDNARESGKLFTSTLSSIGESWPVSRSEVCIGSEIDKT